MVKVFSKIKQFFIRIVGKRFFVSVNNNKSKDFRWTLRSFNNESNKLIEKEILDLIPKMYEVSGIINNLNELGCNLKLDFYRLENDNSNPEI